MARGLLSMLVAATVLAACRAPVAQGPVGPDAVGMSQLAFEPAARTIPVGTRIEFVNDRSRAGAAALPAGHAVLRWHRRPPLRGR